MGAVTEGLGDRRAAPAQRESRPAPACINLIAVDIYQLDLAFHKIRAVGPDADLYGHETPPHKIRNRPHHSMAPTGRARSDVDSRRPMSGFTGNFWTEGR